MTAIELDHGLAQRLAALFAAEVARAETDPDGAGTLNLVEGDALDQDIAALCRPPYDVVANLPYHVTSPILHLLLGAPPRPERAVLMVQREVAELIAAPPGSMSYLSVFVQYHARAVAPNVPPTAFEWSPRSSPRIVLELYRDDADLLPPDEETSSGGSSRPRSGSAGR